MEPTVSSETSAIRTQMPGNYPKRNTLHLEHSESLKTRNRIILLNEIMSVKSRIWRLQLRRPGKQNNTRTFNKFHILALNG